MITEEDIIRVLKREVKEHGQNQTAKRLGFSHTFISDVVNGRSRLTEKLANALGYIKIHKIEWRKK